MIIVSMSAPQLFVDEMVIVFIPGLKVTLASTSLVAALKLKTGTFMLFNKIFIACLFATFSTFAFSEDNATVEMAFIVG